MVGFYNEKKGPAILRKGCLLQGSGWLGLYSEKLPEGLRPGSAGAAAGPLPAGKQGVVQHPRPTRGGC